MAIVWQAATQDNFNKLIAKVPGPMRSIAREQIAKKAEQIAADKNGKEVGEEDLVHAFFEVTPFGFHGPVKCDMEEIGLDYTQYGYER